MSSNSNITHIMRFFEIKFIQLYNDIMTEKSSEKQPRQASNKSSSQRIFFYINLILLVICLFSIKGFFVFREQSKSKGIYVFQTSSLIWCMISFFGRYILKYSYFKYMHNFLSNILSLKIQNQQDRSYRLAALKKLTFDTMYYVSITIASYYAFRKQHWFPKSIGGQGQCDQIYRHYPNWPHQNNNQKNIEIYYMVQFGVHLFEIYQVLFIKGPSYRKFYQWLLHHFISVMLIFFSLLSNQVTMGLAVLIVHDFSDAFSASARAYLQTKFVNDIILAIKFVLMLGSWIYLRLIVYPFCLVKYTYLNTPGPQDMWYSIKYEHTTIVVMAGLLIGMHAFWIYYMVLFGVKNMKKGKLQNPHQQISRTTKIKEA